MALHAESVEMTSATTTVRYITEDIGIILRIRPHGDARERHNDVRILTLEPAVAV
jgi:hypothetical protein